MEKNSKIKQILMSGASLSLSRYMHLCLYEKNFGYYHNKKVGTDFLTSPEVSQFFGECISVFILSSLKNLGKIVNFCELGPGNGTLTEDLIKNLTYFYREDLNFFLVEKTNHIDFKSILKKYKKITISKIDKLHLPKKPFFFLCNEFFDALPVNQYEKNNEFWLERRIKLVNEKLQIVLKKNPYLKIKNDYPTGSVLEISHITNLYLKKIFKHLKDYGGAFLIFDYGPFHKKKVDTIQSIYNKKKSSFLENPYKSDITFHVDFLNIEKLASKYNLYFHGPITQKKFLYYNGINERIISLTKKVKEKKKLDLLYSQFKKLTDPDGLGGLIKCVLVTKKNLKYSFFDGRVT